MSSKHLFGSNNVTDWPKTVNDAMKLLKPFLSNNELELDLTNISDKFKCFMCKNIICEAQVTKCCCKNVCASCIQIFTSTNGYCPNCKEKMMKSDICFDPKLNSKIQMLQVDCPNPNCDAVVAIKDLECHIHICEFGKCLFTSNKSDDAIVRNIRRLQTDFNSFHMSYQQEKVKLDNLVSSICKLNEKHNETTDFQEEMLEKSNEITRDLLDSKTEDKIILNSIESIKQKMALTESFLTNYMEDFKVKLKVQDRVILGEKKDKELKYRELVKETNELKTFCFQLASEHKNVINLLHKKDLEIASLKKTIHSIGELKTQFVFTFSGLDEIKRGDDYYSNEFLLQGYLFKFHLVYRKDDTIHTCLHICKGNRDDAVDWPLRHRMKLTILDGNGADILTHPFQYHISQFKHQYGRPNDESVQMYDSIINKNRQKMIYKNNVCLKLTFN